MTVVQGKGSVNICVGYEKRNTIPLWCGLMKKERHEEEKKDCPHSLGLNRNCEGSFTMSL